MATDGAGQEAAIDEPHLERQTGGDAELADELLAMFAKQSSRHVATIRGPGPLQDRLDAAHTLKGAASAIGAHRVAAAAGEAERALKAADEEAEAVLAELVDATEAARSAIARRT